MSKPMKSFRLYMPDMSPKAVRQNRKTIGRWNGLIIALSSIVSFIYSVIFFTQSSPNVEMGVATLVCGVMSLIVGNEYARWGREP